jgi:hypothetical protein
MSSPTVTTMLRVLRLAVIGWMSQCVWVYAQSAAVAPPLAPNIFEGSSLSAPEIDHRNQISRWGKLTDTPDRLRLMIDFIKPLRDEQRKGPSGLWSLTYFYVSLRDWAAFMYWRPENQQNFETMFAEVAAIQPADSTLLIVKGYVLNATLQAVLDSRVVAVMPQAAHAELVRQRFEAVLTYVESIRGKAENDPGWYLLALDTLNICCPEDEAIWEILREGTRRFPDLYQLYFIALHSIQKCPLADQDAMRKRVIDLAIERTGKTDGEAAYARIMWFLSQHRGSLEYFTGDQVDWPRMRLGIDAVLKRYPDAWNINNFAKFACYAFDREMLPRLMPLAAAHPIRDVWSSQMKFHQCWNYAHPDERTKEYWKQKFPLPYRGAPAP